MPEKTESSDRIEFEDLADDSAQVGEEIPKEVRKLRTQAYDKAVSDLVDMVHSGEMVLDPDYQRNYVWDNKRASLLVESVLLNVPIPVIYVSEDEDGRWIIVDGLQRLNSLTRFFDNEFKLRNLEILDELNSQQYSTLNPKAVRLLRNGILRIIVIKHESHPEIKYDIFQRLNRGAVSLNEQELRNCMYRGPLCSALKELRQYKPFLQSIGLPAPHKRFYDEELILRFLALYAAYDPATGKVVGYPNKMKTFLNRYMEQHRNLGIEELSKLSAVFRQTVDTVVAVIGTPSFRRLKPEDGSYDTRLNRALMDAILVAFARHPQEILLANKAKIAALHASLAAQDVEYNDALIYGTSDTRKLELRITRWFNAINTLEA
jgi:hypothetical protein